MQGLVCLAFTLALTNSTGAGTEVPAASRDEVPADAERAREPTSRAAARPALEDLHTYLRREVPRSARFLDHGVLALGFAGGAPHLYRFDLQVGLFDHLSVGLTAHWLPGQRAPQVWPIAALALWRWQGSRGVGVNLGVHYRPVLHPPVDPELEFVPRTHFGLTSLELAAGWFSVGLDLGVAHRRFALVDPAETLGFRRRAEFGGGVFARAGTRRVGLTLDALAALGPDPLLVFELALDLRFGVFEDRARGGWNTP